MSNTIDSTASSLASYATSSTSSSSSSSKSKSSSLSMDDFFSLLSAELQYQDPMSSDGSSSSSSNSEYMSQLAMFSLLEQVETLSSTVSSLQQASTVGKSVAYTVTNSDGSTSEATGTISAVDMSSSTPSYLVGSTWITQSQILGYYTPSSSTSSGSTSS